MVPATIVLENGYCQKAVIIVVLIVTGMKKAKSVITSRGPKDLKNDTGLVNFFKPFAIPSPMPQNISYFGNFSQHIRVLSDFSNSGIGRIVAV